MLILSTSKSYIFVIFFKQFFGICLFGSAHGLCLLPVLLSIIGPAYVEVDGKASTSKAKKSVEISATELQATPTTASAV